MIYKVDSKTTTEGTVADVLATCELCTKVLGFGLDEVLCCKCC